MEVPLGKTNFPLDWTLKTKARFTSPHPFSWVSSMKTHQEAEGISRYVRGISNTSQGSVDAQCELQRHLMLWMHPSLPFIRLFPRMETKATAPTQLSVLQDQQVVGALKEDWSTSFRSVFQLVKSGHCPYFYLCANQFSALFLSVGVGSSHSTTVLLTPTTRGFRQSMKKEGVDFSLPLASNSSPAKHETTHTTPTITTETAEDSDNDDDSMASSWLHSMGLVTQSFPSIDPHKIAFQRPRAVNIDNRPESVVRVEGIHVHALFNFLLNSKVTVATTGAHAGVPPTLLAPVGFEGASLKSLKVKQGTIQEHVDGKLIRLHSLDISGPILPEMLSQLCSLLQRTQKGEFSGHLNYTDSTSAFNPASKCDLPLPNTPPPPPHICPPHPYLTSNLLLQKNGLREVSCKNGLYTWN